MITSFNLDWEDESDINDLNKIEDLFPNLDKPKLSELFWEDRSVFVDEILSEIMDLLKSGMKKEVKALKIKMAEKSEAESPLQPELKSYIMDFLENGKSLRLDGDLIQKEWFPDKDYDVFLSHSHNDLDKALKIKVLLKHFGLKVFVDSTVWGFADNLLRKIDDAYAQRSEGYYSYNKRNRSTAAVHLMLSTALTQVMDNAEAVFFLNTPNSTLQHFAGTEYDKTLIASPWIYHEIMMTKFLRPNAYKMREKGIINENGDYTKQYENLKMLRSADLSHMQKLSLSKFAGWVSSLMNNEQRRNGCLVIEAYKFEPDSSDTSNVLKRRMKAMENLYSISESSR
ncbi:MAG: hypothetical protein PUI83_04655 [Dialister sp.]|nr:hypothetical protein [Dialister sp.]